MSAIFSTIIALIIFSILVIVHEFGHCIAAKKSGILVEEFAVGMGPLIWGKQIGETLYSVRLFPLGGFCRMLGEDADCHGERSFQDKSLFARIAVVAAGPLMNFVLALILIFCLVSTTVVPQPTVTQVTPDSPGAAIGLMEGDVIKKIDGKNIYIYDDLDFIMSTYGGGSTEVEILRDGKRLTYQITPEYSQELRKYIIGFTPQIYAGLFTNEPTGMEKASFLTTVEYSFDTMCFYIRQTAIGLAKIFTFSISKDEVSGPIGIVKVVGDGFEAGMQHSVGAAIQNMLFLAALLSANLGVMNLFPIPALDGGRLIFLIIEGLRRKPVNAEMEGRIHFVGFVFLLCLMALIAFNDVSKIFLQ